MGKLVLICFSGTQMHAFLTSYLISLLVYRKKVSPVVISLLPYWRFLVIGIMCVFSHINLLISCEFFYPFGFSFCFFLFPFLVGGSDGFMFFPFHSSNKQLGKSFWMMFGLEFNFCIGGLWFIRNVVVRSISLSKKVTEKIKSYSYLKLINCLNKYVSSTVILHRKIDSKTIDFTWDTNGDAYGFWPFFPQWMNKLVEESFYLKQIYRTENTSPLEDELFFPGIS